MLFPKLLIFLEGRMSKIFEKLSYDLTYLCGLEIMLIISSHFGFVKSLDVSANDLILVVRLTPANCPHETSPNTRTGGDGVDELFGFMKEV